MTRYTQLPLVKMPRPIATTRPIVHPRHAPTRTTRTPRQAQIWADRDFRCFFVGESVSLFGSEISTMIFPIIDAVVLKASPFAISLLAVFGWLPYVVWTLPAEAWVDRVRDRPLMIAADALRAVLLILIPLCFLLGQLQIEILLVIEFGLGSGLVIFLLAYNAYVQHLVPRRCLITANGALEASSSVAKTGGPALAGLLLHWIAAPFALVVDAGSFLCSAVNLMRIHRHETPSPAHHAKP